MGDVIRKIRTVYSGGKGEITEKKSRFIAELRPVSSEAEAEGFWKKYGKEAGMQDITVLHMCSESGRSWYVPVMTGNLLEQPEGQCWIFCWVRGLRIPWL